MNSYYSNGNDVGGVFLLLAVIVLLFIYFIPTYVANRRDHKNVFLVFLVNLFFGGTGVGWIAALIWAAAGPTKSSLGSNSKADELKKLHNLLKEGAITQEEYDKSKQNILNN